MLHDAFFWAAFRDWHVRTDHAWDLALHRDAMSMGLDGIARQIVEQLVPAMEDANRAVRAFFAALGPVDPNVALRQAIR